MVRREREREKNPRKRELLRGEARDARRELNELERAAMPISHCDNNLDGEREMLSATVSRGVSDFILSCNL